MSEILGKPVTIHACGHMVKAYFEPFKWWVYLLLPMFAFYYSIFYPERIAEMFYKYRKETTANEPD